MSQNADLVLYCGAELGEGPCWDEKRGVLWWVDITGKRLYSFDPVSKSNVGYIMPSAIGTVAPAKNGVIVALADGFFHFSPNTGKFRAITDPESDKPYNRFNDGKCDPKGRFWAGTMAYTPEAPKQSGALYCLHIDGRVTREAVNVSTSNGIGFSPDNKTMYYIDTPTRNVDAFDFNIETGAVSNRHTVLTLDDTHGGPDGMTVDTEGYLWVAEWGGGRVGRWDVRSKEMVDEIRLPANRVTACAFGGPDCDTLYITTAKDPSLDEPIAGALFSIKPGAKGLPAFVYCGG